MQIFIKELLINDVRGLSDIKIPVAESSMKHLIITGKNGSGKTSVLNSISSYLNALATDQYFCKIEDSINVWENKLKKLKADGASENEIYEVDKRKTDRENKNIATKSGIELTLNLRNDSIFSKFSNNEFILAFYEANRIFQVNQSKNIEKITLKDKYTINEKPRSEFTKFFADMKVTQALASTGNNFEKAQSISVWFDEFEHLLRNIFTEKSLELIFDEDTFTFKIRVDNKPDFDFNTLSSGYAAVLDIVVDLIMRMQKKSQRKFVFDMPGIVLIDEIETHLHIDLQKSVLSLLTTLFPNIQFILTTHSPFILSSIDTATIYDLENKTLVVDSLIDVSYEGIVEGYFKVDEMSNKINDEYNKYKMLVGKNTITDDDLVAISKLELILDEVPDFLALDLTTEYERLKLEFNLRGDI